MVRAVWNANKTDRKDGRMATIIFRLNSSLQYYRNHSKPIIQTYRDSVKRFLTGRMEEWQQ